MIAPASRRSRFEIYVDILTEIKNGTVLPTRIMYGANLSWSTLIQTLEKLTTQGLIEEQPIESNKRKKNSYTLTEKGNNFLNYLNRINELIEPQKTVEIPA